MFQNKVVLGIVSTIAIFAFLTVVYMVTSTPSNTNVVVAEAKEINTTDHVTWSKNKKVILTEYGDLQCPACASFHDYIKSQIETDKSITDNVTFVFRHFPLTMHKNAEQAAYAAEAASKQGKFFEMSDILFTKQKDWENSNNPKEYFQNVAKQLKLDVDTFTKDMDSKEIKDKVQADIASGASAGVDSTPTFYLDGKKLDVGTLQNFKQLLQDSVKQ